MLTVTSDDLFSSSAQTLVNPVNTVGVMGKGLALEFKRRFPAMFGSYQRCCRSGAFDVGMLHLFKGADRWILNLPTKRHWRDRSQLEWIASGLLKFSETYEAHGISSVAFPLLGCGHGGLARKDVEPMMIRALGILPILASLHTGVTAR